MKATDAIAKIHDRFAVDPISDVQVITREEFEAITEARSKWKVWADMRADWIVQHRDATPEQITQAEQTIAKELGI